MTGRAKESIFCSWGANVSVKSNSTIPVVEDESNDQFLIQTALQDVGVTGPIQKVGDGLEAIA